MIMTYQEVEAIRNEIGATIEAMCSILGISKSTYYSWSQPSRSPCGSTLELLKLLRSDPIKIYADLRNRQECGAHQSIKS